MRIKIKVALVIFGVCCYMYSLAATCDQLNVIQKAAEVSDSHYQLTSLLPEFTSSNTACDAQSINLRINALGEGIQRRYLQNLPQKSMNGANTLSVTYELLNNDKGLLSLKITEEAYYAKQAHPIETLHSLTINLNTNKELKLSEVLSDNNALVTLANYAREVLKQRFAESMTIDENALSWLEQGTAPTEANYAVWNITPKGLLVTFSPYQVAPRQFGAPTVLMSNDQFTTLSKVSM